MPASNEEKLIIEQTGNFDMTLKSWASEMQCVQNDEEDHHCDGPKEKRERPKRAEKDRDVRIEGPQTHAEVRVSVPRVARQPKDASQQSPALNTTTPWESGPAKTRGEGTELLLQLTRQVGAGADDEQRGRHVLDADARETARYTHEERHVRCEQCDRCRREQRERREQRTGAFEEQEVGHTRATSSNTNTIQ